MLVFVDQVRVILPNILSRILLTHVHFIYLPSTALPTPPLPHSNPNSLRPSCFAKSSHEGVRSKTISALHDLSTKLKTPSAQARCSHLLAILTQSGASASRGSHEYVKAVFDDLAPVFESRLVDTLGYRVPWILHERVEEHFRSNDSHLVTEYVNKSLSIIDLGCGTGLVGKCFSNLVRDKW